MSSSFDVSCERLLELSSEKTLDLLEELGGVQGIASALKTDLKQGISSDSASIQQRIKTFGPNKFTPRETTSFLGFVWESLHDKTLIILLIAAAVSLGLGIWKVSYLAEALYR